jgi:hypothetical protein
MSHAVENMPWSNARQVFLTARMVVMAVVPVNLKRRIISSMVGVLFLGSSAHAQTGAWQAVENLRPGTHISVKTQHNYPCLFASASEEELVCYRPRNRLLRLPATITIPRGEIREVRMEPNQAKEAWIEAAIGAGAGAAAAASNSRTSPGANAF